MPNITEISQRLQKLQSYGKGQIFLNPVYYNCT